VSERTQVCRRAFDAWNRGDLDGVVDCYEPDATIVLPEMWPDAGTVQGRDAIREFYARFEESWSQGSTVEPRTFEERGETVIVPVASRAVGRAAGVGVDFDYTMFFSVPRDLISRVEFHLGQRAGESPR
jgi:ketosteroid isomerase-like protein